jgi:hypothetical protein
MVYHPYKVLWDNIINTDSGLTEDPRHTINRSYGELNFGFVLTDGQGAPLEDGSWHVWRWCEYAPGWAHIIKLQSKEPVYLDLIVRNLYLQDLFNRKYKNRGYSRYLESLDIQERHKKIEEQNDLMKEVNKANSAMVGRAMENFQRNITAPSNPTVDKIFSSSGVSKRSKIVRPATDREGGLILPAGYGEE